MLRRPKGKISMLPENVRDQINDKIRNGWQYRTIRDWLFAQRAEQDIPDLQLKAGDLYALVWSRDAKTKRSMQCTCLNALSDWYRTHYRSWLKDQLSFDRALRLVEENEQLSSLASDKAQPDSNLGGTLIVRSLLMDAIRALCEDEEAANPAQLARLANAWARMSDTGLRGQQSLDAGLQSLRDEIKSNPNALEHFNKLYATLKHPSQKKS